VAFNNNNNNGWPNRQSRAHSRISNVSNAFDNGNIGSASDNKIWTETNGSNGEHGTQAGSHRDYVIHYNGDQEKQPLYFPDFNTAFTYAIQELKISWRWYRMAYEKEMGK
jgi:hypothetical protein